MAAKRKYWGYWGRTARRRCPHVALEGIYGDAIIGVGYWRLFCRDCHRFLDGPVWLSRRLAPNTHMGE